MKTGKSKKKQQQVNKLFKSIPTDKIIELNDLIYAGKKIIKKLDILQRNLNEKKKINKNWIGNEIRRTNTDITKIRKVQKEEKKNTRIQ